MPAIGNFLGVLGLHQTQTDGSGTHQIRHYDFHSVPLGDAGQRLEQARRAGRVKTYSVQTRIFGWTGQGILNHRQQAILDGLIGETTRGRASDREDRADIVVGNRVPAAAGQSQIKCGLLRRGQRYVSFNGNGVRRHRGYRVIGEQGRGWLYKCGFGTVAPNDRPAEVQSFLAGLGQLSETLGLVVAAVDPRAGTWVNLQTLLTMARSRTGWQAIDRLHLRLYGPEDYLQRLRGYVVGAAGFRGIQVPASVPVANSVALDLKARMERLGITHAELAEHLGKKRPYVTAVLNEKRPWPDGMLPRCEEFLAFRERGRDRD